MAHFKYGRKPKVHDYFPHFSSVFAGVPLPAPHPINWTNNMPNDLNMMLNDSLGDCTCAAWGHAVQVWTHNANPPMLTLANNDIELLYEKSCGYVPGNPSTDQGGDCQTVLNYLTQQGLANNHLRSAVFIDPSSMSNVQLAIDCCALVYIGFNVPNYLQNLENPGSIWGVPGEVDIPKNAPTDIVGGHCVVVPAFELNGNMTIISWGSFYTMTPGFWHAYVDEAYALADHSWVNTKGVDPNNQSMGDMLQLMAQAGSSIGPPNKHHHHHHQQHKKN